MDHRGTNVLYTIGGTGDGAAFVYKTKTMENGYRDAHHTFGRLKIVRVTGGAGVWQIGESAVAVATGDLLVFGNGDLRHIERVTSSEPLCIEQVEFTPVALYPWQDLAGFFFNTRRACLLPRVAPHHARIGAAFDEMRAELAVEARGKDAYLIHLLIGMVISAARLADPAGGGVMRADTSYGIVCAAVREIQEHPAGDLSRSALAKRYHISPSHFSRIFKEYSGVGVCEYVMRCRVARAVELLTATDRTVLDIALSCGFSTSSGFYRAFAAVTGRTPRAFRAKHEP